MTPQATSTTSGPRNVTVANTAPPPPTGLVAGYGMNEGSGSTTADASGHGITGTLTNGPTWADGKFGRAVGFDGANDYIDLGNPSALRITGSMTISAWINSAVFPGDDAAIVSKRGGAVGFQLDTTIDRGPRTIGFKLTSASGGAMFRYGATAMQTNTWYHVAGVYNAATRTVDVYLNGQLDNASLDGTITASQQDSPLNVAIGRRPGSSGFEFNGRIDDVRIYDRALTAAEIQADMITAIGNQEPGDAVPPLVTLTAPAANAEVADILNVTADADDNVGVVGVQFYVDGVAAGVEDDSDPYALAWDTRTVTNGPHILTARARDAAGNEDDLVSGHRERRQLELLPERGPRHRPQPPDGDEVPSRRPPAGGRAGGADPRPPAALHHAGHGAVPADHQRRLGGCPAGHLRLRPRPELRHQPPLLRLLHVGLTKS